MRSDNRVVIGLVTALLGGVANAQGKTYLTRAEALELAFPGSVVTRVRHSLDDRAAARIAKAAGEKTFARRLWFTYVARKQDTVVGTAYFDAHRVRTHRQIVMVVVTPKGKIDRVELLAFAEPIEYVPRAKWYRQFDQRQLDLNLRVGRGIHSVTGATLTARATTRCTRRMLALHAELARVTPRSKPTSQPSSKSTTKPALKPTSRPTARSTR